MTEEAYVSFEVAKLLKEKGFEIDTDKGYWKIGKDGTMYFMSPVGAYTSDINDKFAFYRPADTYPCPTQQMAMRWLREVNNLFVDYEITLYGWNYSISAVSRDSNHEIIGVENRYFDSYYDTYEEAAEAAIKYCLENLIKND